MMCSYFVLVPLFFSAIEYLFCSVCLAGFPLPLGARDRMPHLIVVLPKHSIGYFFRLILHCIMNNTRVVI